jgi:hypothetical protein
MQTACRTCRPPVEHADRGASVQTPNTWRGCRSIRAEPRPHRLYTDSAVSRPVGAGRDGTRAGARVENAVLWPPRPRAAPTEAPGRLAVPAALRRRPAAGLAPDPHPAGVTLTIWRGCPSRPGSAAGAKPSISLTKPPPRGGRRPWPGRWVLTCSSIRTLNSPLAPRTQSAPILRRRRGSGPTALLGWGSARCRQCATAPSSRPSART